MPTLSTLVSFNASDGGESSGSLIANARGDLLGVNNNVFEIVKTATGYASTPTTLASLGSTSLSNLASDARGDLFGTTYGGGPNNDGTVFELAKTAHGYATTPITLASFDGSNGANPIGSLVVGPGGDLFGTTLFGGTDGLGTAFEIAKTTTGYASTPTTLVNFADGGGTYPEGGLVADAHGDLFGVTNGGDGSLEGTAYEIAKTANGYASTATTLVSGLHDISAASSLFVDAHGDLFGTTSGGGGLGNDGTVFEIAKTASGYASTATTLVSFNGSDGAFPAGNLIADAKGDLFGTTSGGGTNNDGTVFEIAKTATGYASTPITLANFNGSNGAEPFGNLVANAKGDLFGSTGQGGANGDGTVFEITDSGYLGIPGSHGMAFLGGQGMDRDKGQRSAPKAGPGQGHDVLANFGADFAQGMIHPPGGGSGGSSAWQAYAVPRSGGHGGSLLTLGDARSLDTSGISAGHVHATGVTMG